MTGNGETTSLALSNSKKVHPAAPVKLTNLHVTSHCLPLLGFSICISIFHFFPFLLFHVTFTWRFGLCTGKTVQNSLINSCFYRPVRHQLMKCFIIFQLHLWSSIEGHCWLVKKKCYMIKYKVPYHINILVNLATGK